jgi:hypothetical protein
MARLGRMTQQSYRVHLSIALGFLVAVVLSIANDLLELGFFGRGARAVAAATVLAFVVYGALFMPTRQELREYLDERRSGQR